ncbi:hypothetical protein D049_0131B, partial [Vibrio parahaemolyticus VPTS-2010]
TENAAQFGFASA